MDSDAENVFQLDRLFATEKATVQVILFNYRDEIEKFSHALDTTCQLCRHMKRARNRGRIRMFFSTERFCLKK